MKLKYFYISIIIITIIICLVYIITTNTYAYQYTSNNYTLFYKDNKEELEQDINKYINDIDNFLMVNSNYELSDTLSENYIFLVNFAIDYILFHKEEYKDKIIYLDNYNYKDEYYNDKTTNEYINIEEIYKITNKYFNKKDFIILNDNINIINNYVSLSDYTERTFKNTILSITTSQNNDIITAYITYDNNQKYKYTFKIYNNVLKINNVEVSE